RQIRCAEVDLERGRAGLRFASSGGDGQREASCDSDTEERGRPFAGLWCAVVEDRFSRPQRYEYSDSAQVRYAAGTGRRSGDHVGAGEQEREYVDTREGLAD